MMREDMEAMGAVRLKEVDEAQAAIVAAAGNGGVGARPYYPAAYEDVLAVTAISGKKRKVYKSANRGSYIDFAAPGVKVYAAVPGGGQNMSGTSFASPFVAVIVALQAAHMRRTPGRLRKLLKRGAIDLGTPGKDDVYGWGMINMQPSCPR
jgi:subtilisin family serine protease